MPDTVHSSYNQTDQGHEKPTVVHVFNSSEEEFKKPQ